VILPCSIRRALLAASLLAASSLAAHALEHVTLRNGFSYDCARQQALGEGHVRLFTTADGNNFIDIPAAEIASVETLPDPPPPMPAAATAAKPEAAADIEKAVAQLRSKAARMSGTARVTRKPVARPARALKAAGGSGGFALDMNDTPDDRDADFLR